MNWIITTQPITKPITAAISSKKPSARPKRGKPITSNKKKSPNYRILSIKTLSAPAPPNRHRHAENNWKKWTCWKNRPAMIKPSILISRLIDQAVMRSSRLIRQQSVMKPISQWQVPSIFRLTNTIASPLSVRMGSANQLYLRASWEKYRS